MIEEIDPDELLYNLFYSAISDGNNYKGYSDFTNTDVAKSLVKYIVRTDSAILEMKRHLLLNEDRIKNKQDGFLYLDGLHRLLFDGEEDQLDE